MRDTAAATGARLLSAQHVPRCEPTIKGCDYWSKRARTNERFTNARLLLVRDLTWQANITQFRCIKIQPETIHLSTRLWGINPTNSVVILQKLELMSIVLG